MKEIRFRAWDKETKQIFTVHELHWDMTGRLIAIVVNGNEHIDQPFGTYRLSKKDCELMQYTGLKDKNGVEIYEEDVARYDDGELTSVSFSRGSFRTSGIYNLSAGDNIEVIGNIYENPDLLKEQS